MTLRDWRITLGLCWDWLMLRITNSYKIYGITDTWFVVSPQACWLGALRKVINNYASLLETSIIWRNQSIILPATYISLPLWWIGIFVFFACLFPLGTPFYENNLNQYELLCLTKVTKYGVLGHAIIECLLDEINAYIIKTTRKELFTPSTKI